MNLLVKKLKAVASILLVSLFFVSCEDPGKIGLNINTSKGSFETKYKEFILPSTQVQFNPRSTVNSNTLQAGAYYDTDFGTVTSKTYTWLGVESSTPTLNNNATYDSISISIRYSSFYGSEAENEEIASFDIYQLADDISPSVDYSRLDEISLSQKLGMMDLIIKQNDTLRNDSLYTFSLDNTFGQSLFDKLKANDGTFDDDTLFNAFFKGIAIINTSANNKIFQLNSSSFAIRLNYHEVNASGDNVSRSYTFDLGNRNFFNLESDLSGTSLSGIQPDNTDFTPATHFRYLQSGTMIGLKLDYSSLIDFLDSLGNKAKAKIIVQKATLSVGSIAENPDGQGYPFALVGYFTDENNKWPILKELTATTEMIDVFVALQEDLVFAGSYIAPQEIILDQTDTTTYKATMVSFIQNMFNGNYNANETPLEPRGELILFTPTSTSSPQSTPSHVLTHHFKIHSDSIKIKLYYSDSNL